MNRFLMVCGLAAAFASSASVASAQPMDLSTVDCTQSGMMMMKMPDSSMMPSPAPSMTTDQAFDAMSHMMMMHTTMMAGVELKCGKDAKSRAMAAKLLRQLGDDGSTQAMEILHTYGI